MEGSPWRQPYLAELTFGEMFRLVNRLVSGQNLRILEVGCGRGYLSLELARRGIPTILNVESWNTKFQILPSGTVQTGSLTS